MLLFFYYNVIDMTHILTSVSCINVYFPDVIFVFYSIILALTLITSTFTEWLMW